MADVSLNEIYRAIGALTAQVEELERKFDKADDSRAKVHSRIDELTSEVGGVKTAVETMKADVSDSKEVTDDVKRWRQMGIGALAVVGIGGTAFGVAISDTLGNLAKFFHR